MDRSGKSTSPTTKAQREIFGWGVHTVALIIGQLVIWKVFNQSWAAERLGQGDQDDGWLNLAGRVWLVIYVIDTLWSWSYVVFPRREKE